MKQRALVCDVPERRVVGVRRLGPDVPWGVTELDNRPAYNKCDWLCPMLLFKSKAGARSIGLPNITR